MNKYIYSLLFVTAFLPVGVSAATSNDDKGLQIARQVDLHDQGWKDMTAKMTMELRNRQGEQSTRAIRVKFLEVMGDGDKGLTIFDNPRDVKGTAFLSFSHIIRPDDQWLFLPALKRVKRISSANKSGPFMGSQFAFEDLASFEVDKYRYKYLRDEKVTGIKSFVVENYPNYKYSGYKRQIVWVDKTRYIPLKIEYYDRKNDLLKTLLFKDYNQYLGKYWRAHTQIMKNHQNGKITTLSLSQFQFQSGLTEKDFKRNSLKRAR